MQTGTRAEFAAHRNVNRSTVTRWAHAEKLVFTEDGLVDFAASSALIDSSADPTKHGVALRHAREREAKMVEREITPGAKTPTGASQLPPPPPPDGDAATGEPDSHYAAFNKARAEKEAELAKLARIKREEQEGALIRKDEIKRDVEHLAAIVSKGITGIPARIMPLINAEADPGLREQILEAELRKVLAEFADAALALGGTAPGA